MQGPSCNAGCLIEDSLARVNPPSALWPPILKTKSVPDKLGCLSQFLVSRRTEKGGSREPLFCSQCENLSPLVHFIVDYYWDAERLIQTI